LVLERVESDRDIFGLPDLDGNSVEAKGAGRCLDLTHL
jgi:hypothetical protein